LTGLLENGAYLSVAQSVKRIVSGRGSFFSDRFGLAEYAPEQASAASFLSQVDAELANVPPCCGQCSAQPTWDSSSSIMRSAVRHVKIVVCDKKALFQIESTSCRSGARDHIHNVKTFVGAEEVEELMVLHDQRKVESQRFRPSLYLQQGRFRNGFPGIGRKSKLELNGGACCDSPCSFSPY